VESKGVRDLNLKAKFTTARSEISGAGGVSETVKTRIGRSQGGAGKIDG
jgi:hypothetical protein